METEIKEKIKVLSLFENGKMRPAVFQWRRRIYKVLRVIFTYSKDVGKEKLLYFSVECSSPPDSEANGVFELSFNRERFSWEIEKVF